MPDRPLTNLNAIAEQSQLCAPTLHCQVTLSKTENGKGAAPADVRAAIHFAALEGSATQHFLK